METIFGQLISPQTITAAILPIYTLWFPEYLSEVERKEQLKPRILPRPPTPESYSGGIDFESWREETGPQVMVLVEPTGNPEALASGDPNFNAHGEQESRGAYSQDYEIQVGCLVAGEGASEIAENPQDEARIIASYYGAASMLLVDRPPEFGVVSTDCILTQSPRLTFPNSNYRNIVLSTTIFHLYVSAIKLLSAGPTSEKPQESPYYKEEEAWGKEPSVLSQKTTVTDTNPL